MIYGVEGCACVCEGRRQWNTNRGDDGGNGDCVGHGQGEGRITFSLIVIVIVNVGVQDDGMRMKVMMAVVGGQLVDGVEEVWNGRSYVRAFIFLSVKDGDRESMVEVKMVAIRIAVMVIVSDRDRIREGSNGRV